MKLDLQDLGFRRFYLFGASMEMTGYLEKLKKLVSQFNSSSVSRNVLPKDQDEERDTGMSEFKQS